MRRPAELDGRNVSAVRYSVCQSLKMLEVVCRVLICWEALNMTTCVLLLYHSEEKTQLASMESPSNSPALVYPQTQAPCHLNPAVRVPAALLFPLQRQTQSPPHLRRDIEHSTQCQLAARSHHRSGSFGMLPFINWTIRSSASTSMNRNISLRGNGI